MLRAEQFQIAWSTNDIEQAKAMFRAQFGIERFGRLEGPLAAGGEIRVELAWVGGTMYELIEARGAGSEVYNTYLPETRDFAIRHHHYGYLIRDAAEWAGLMRQIEENRLTIAGGNHTPGFIRYCFVHLPLMSHYLEFIFPEAAGIAYFESVPAH